MHKTLTIKEQFGVIRKQAEVKEVSICDVNGICDNQENSKNCPQDCASGMQDDFCDKEIDGKCDPDCKEDEDQDCYKETLVDVLEVEKESGGIKKQVEKEKEYSKENLVLVILIVILLMVLFWLFKSKKKRGFKI